MNDKEKDFCIAYSPSDKRFSEKENSKASKSFHTLVDAEQLANNLKDGDNARSVALSFLNSGLIDRKTYRDIRNYYYDIDKALIDSFIKRRG